jgi:hypothetical protein
MEVLIVFGQCRSTKAGRIDEEAQMIPKLASITLYQLSLHIRDQQMDRRRTPEHTAIFEIFNDVSRLLESTGVSASRTRLAIHALGHNEQVRTRHIRASHPYLQASETKHGKQSRLP